MKLFSELPHLSMCAFSDKTADIRKVGLAVRSSSVVDVAI